MGTSLAPPSDPAHVAVTLRLPTIAATRRLGRTLGTLAEPGDLFGLDGPLGAGKSLLVTALAQGLGIPPPIPSPTFSLVNLYEPPASTTAAPRSRQRLRFVHADLYRLQHPAELLDLGLWEAAESGAVLAIEWLARFPEALPADRLHIHLVPADPAHPSQGRVATLTAQGARANQLLAGLLAHLSPSPDDN